MKSSVRIISFLLSACLIADPVTAVGMRAGTSSTQSQKFVTSIPGLRARFQEEALTAYPLWFGQTLERIKQASSRARKSIGAWRQSSEHRGSKTSEMDQPDPLHIAEKIDLRDGDGVLRDLSNLMKEFIREIIPREASKKNDETIRKAIFRNINGLVLIPVLFVFAHSETLSSDQSMLRLITERPGITLKEVSQRFNPGHEESNMGYKYGFLRVLALQGWIKMQGKDEETTYSMTPLGQKILEITERNKEVLEKAAQSFDHSQRYYELFRKPSLLPTERKALLEYKRLIRFSQKRWIPDAVDEDPLAQEAVGQLRRALDGLLMSPTMVALGMPQYERVGPLIKEAAPSFYREGNSNIHLDQLDFPYNGEFLRAALDLLATQQPFDKSLGEWKGNIFEFSDDGVDFMRRRGSFGVPVSYLRAYQPEFVEDMAYNPQLPDPAGIARYDHFDPLVNGWGSAMQHTVFLPDILEQALPMIQQGALGSVELGSGSGRIIATVTAASVGWRNILNRYDAELIKDQRLPLGPRSSRAFLAIGADITRAARRRTLDRFTVMFKGRPDIEYRSVFGDVTRPIKFAAKVKRLTHISVDKLVHLMMFVIEERHLRVFDKTTAETIFATRVARLESDSEGREELAKILQEMQVLKASEALPSGTRLARLVADQFDISMSQLGSLVPAEVAGADLIRFMEDFAVIHPLGVLVYDVCTTGINQLDWRVGVQPDVNYWGTHLLREKIYTEPQRKLAYLLAGFRFKIPPISYPRTRNGKGPDGKAPALVGFSILHKAESMSPGIPDARRTVEVPVGVPASRRRRFPHLILTAA